MREEYSHLLFRYKITFLLFFIELSISLSRVLDRYLFIFDLSRPRFTKSIFLFLIFYIFIILQENLDFPNSVLFLNLSLLNIQ